MENAIVLTAAVLGIVQACKIAGLPSKYSPIMAVLIGMILYLALDGISAENAETGIVIGLSAVGLYTSGSQVGDGKLISETEIKNFNDNLKR